MEEIFFEIGAVIIIAATISMLAHRFRQPLIIAYILTGIIIGPSILALARSAEMFDTLAQIGVAFLLFTVGLGLNWRGIKDVGGIALLTGIGQVIFTTFFGWFIGYWLGFGFLTSLYLATAFAFSSTIIIVKMLIDKEDLDSLYGRISVGFLLVQDFIAMIVLLVLSSFNTSAGPIDIFTQILMKTIIVIPLLWFTSVKILPTIARYAARSQELLFVFSIAWCFLVASGFVLAGFSMEIGALIAGVMLSGTVYQREINTRIHPLRDFFLIIFFIVLGTHLGFSDLSANIGPILIFSAFILIGNPLIVLLIMRLQGYHPRTGFLAGTTVAQISEFSFIVLAAGVSLGHLPANLMSTAAAVGLLTIGASSYLIKGNDQIYERLQFIFRLIEPRKINKSKSSHTSGRAKIYLFGFDHIGRQLLPIIKKLPGRYGIVDFDPSIVDELNLHHEPIFYGDVADENFLTEIQAQQAQLIISSIPDEVISLDILSYLKRKKFTGTVVVTVHHPREAQRCYEAGATFVIIPRVLTGERLRELLKRKKTQKSKWKELALDEQDFLSRLK